MNSQMKNMFPKFLRQCNKVKNVKGYIFLQLTVPHSK